MILVALGSVIKPGTKSHNYFQSLQVYIKCSTCNLWYNFIIVIMLLLQFIQCTSAAFCTPDYYFQSQFYYDMCNHLWLVHDQNTILLMCNKICWQPWWSSCTLSDIIFQSRVINMTSASWCILVHPVNKVLKRKALTGKKP